MGVKWLGKYPSNEWNALLTKITYTGQYTPTDFTFTGQRSNMDSIGLMFYNARWYDPYLKCLSGCLLGSGFNTFNNFGCTMPSWGWPEKPKD